MAGLRALMTVLLVLAALPAAAAPVGKVLGARGPVFRELAGKAEVLAAGAPLNQSDVVVSGPGGKAKLELRDGTILSLGENTRLRLDEVKTTGGTPSAHLGLEVGALRAAVTKRLANGRFEVETETAVAAVRGTEFVVEAARDASAIGLVTGVVAVRGKGQRAPAVITLDAPGQGTDIAFDEAPTAPAIWSGARLAGLLARTSFE